MARPTKYCREEMLAKATALFWEKGYRGVSIQDLVKETGVLAGSIYGCFGNKDGIFLECVRHYAEKSAAMYREAETRACELGWHDGASLRVQAVSGETQKGRHTTTARELHLLPGGRVE